MTVSTITSIEALEAIYGGLSGLAEASVAKVTSHLTTEYRQLIEASPFVALATVGPEGLDCSPRGEPDGVVTIEDDRTLLLPDWRGNNRIDSLRNIVRDPRVSLMFLIPGSATVMRVNGHAVITTEPAVVERFEIDGKRPRTVVVVTIDEVYFQCARAVMRADLWNPERFRDVNALPSAGTMIKAAKAGFDKETYDREWPECARKTMW
jgi:uncharacterized protein